MSGEWDEQQNTGRCMEDPSRQQLPETNKRKKKTPNQFFKTKQRIAGKCFVVGTFAKKDVTKGWLHTQSLRMNSN